MKCLDFEAWLTSVHTSVKYFALISGISKVTIAIQTLFLKRLCISLAKQSAEHNHNDTKIGVLGINYNSPEILS
ncbi:hypothetical protein BpHYR1_007360 [Brachionus plicatilis]|uniref:Uncharacterized protein n=1 Tax=Brachionus plicatilis TaxID=10195 RepID=A0A3M7PD25_BRAPC|nr:hypothetical protein BpHYR1_007360 [Brachionus plicatilis]